jgi:alkylated DNA repair protein (DNA oxidative demethylase)
MFLQGCGSKGTEGAEAGGLPIGCRLFRGFFNAAQQAELAAEIAGIIAEAPLYHPRMPRTNKPFSVAMTNCGPLGWYSDKDGGYRYEHRHPVTARPWPAIPERLRRLWLDVAGFAGDPEACLINHYSGKAKMGLHRDEDEAELGAPIVSVSLGDSALFRLGGLARRDPTVSFPLHSGDVLLMGGPSRLIYHGIDRIRAGSSGLLPQGGRINLTMRRVTPAREA